MANTTTRRGKGPAPTGKTPQISMRLSADTLGEMDAISAALGLESRTDVVR